MNNGVFGDFVLTGGELAAMMMIDSIVRLIPGVLGGEKSAEIESFQMEKRWNFHNIHDLRSLKVYVCRMFY